PEEAEQYVAYLRSVGRLDEAAQVLARLVNDERFVSRQGKSNYQGTWGVRDFTQVFDSYARFEESVIAALLDTQAQLGHGQDEEVELELRLARFERLMARRPLLLNSVLLRQNPHNVHEWHKRVALHQGQPDKIIQTFTEAVRTVDPQRATGRPHELWVAFARFYEDNGQLDDARSILSRATRVRFRRVEDLAAVWCEFGELELRHQRHQEALSVLRVGKPKTGVQARIALFQWCHHAHVPIVPSVPAGVRTRIALFRWCPRVPNVPVSPQAYECGIALFRWCPHAHAYERGIALFRWCPHAHVPGVPMPMSGGTELFGVTHTRPIYQRAIEVLGDDAARELCLRFADMECKLGEVDRARAIYTYCSQICDPRITGSFWQTWKEFEIRHGNEDTIREMLRIKRSVQATYNTQVNFMASQMLKVSGSATGTGSWRGTGEGAGTALAQHHRGTEEGTGVAPGGARGEAPLSLQGNPEEIDLDEEGEEPDVAPPSRKLPFLPRKLLCHPPEVTLPARKLVSFPRKLLSRLPEVGYSH
ncbi:pre-mRNA-splicing factor SYF1, partial [Pyrgilauda ruficollis]|uniref:pre-mRNA-splicing factor SYF1 n=1 Tax=Pyrgilauda ruficollis TaxID=221976 RepID=UPI001B8832D7